MPDVMDELSKPESPVSAEPPAQEVPGRSPVKFIALGMLLLAFGIGAWAWFHFRDRVSSDDAQVDAHMMAVAPKIPGNVLEVLVKDNQSVKAGDVLVRIDPRDYQARVDIARAAWISAFRRSLTPDFASAAKSGTPFSFARANCAIGPM